MKIKAKHSQDGSIYYVTEKMIRDSKGLFVPVEDTPTVEQKSSVEDTDIDLNDLDDKAEEDRLEAMRAELRNRGVTFHPNCGEKALMKKLKDSE